MNNDFVSTLNKQESIFQFQSHFCRNWRILKRVLNCLLIKKICFWFFQSKTKILSTKPMKILKIYLAKKSRLFSKVLSNPEIRRPSASTFKLHLLIKIFCFWDFNSEIKNLFTNQTKREKIYFIKYFNLCGRNGSFGLGQCPESLGACTTDMGSEKWFSRLGLRQVFHTWGWWKTPNFLI